MNIETALKFVDSVSKLLGVVIWPTVIVFFLVRFGSPLREFIANLSEFSFKAAGVEATGRRQQAEAATFLAAAAIKGKDEAATPELAAHYTRLAAETVADAATPKVIRHAAGSAILWVDDKPNNNLNERQSLQALGISFALALSTDEALEKLKQQSFDAVISDMGRPPDPQAGYTLLDKLRNNGNQIPFIIYSSSRLPEDQAEARRRGAIGCTNRPSDLFEMVLSVVGRWRDTHSRLRAKKATVAHPFASPRPQSPQAPDQSQPACAHSS